jgi:uncharacterized protein YdgA (DUF945 family)
VRLSKALAQRLALLVAQAQLADDDSIPPEQLTPEQLTYLAETQAGLMLTMLAAQGVLVDTGDGYSSAVNVTNGSLTLNGNTLPFGLQ